MEQFPPPLIPSSLVSDRYPALKRFLLQQVDMQVADMRLLMRLPVPELDPNVGCNLTMAAMLLNLISGFSVWFYETEDAAAIAATESAGRKHSKKRFIGFVTTYWPRIAPEADPAEAAERLYEVRNSLVHDLGAHDDPGQAEPRAVKLNKAPFSLDDVVTGFERNLAHPLTVPVIEESGGTVTVHLPGLYWATLRMLSTALRDRPDEINGAIAKVTFADIEEASV